jgi:hypothetical protein
MPRHLLIVSRDSPQLATYLRHHFSDAPEVEVLLDRRRRERRRHANGATPDRRRADRRIRQHVDKEIRLTSYAFVTLP